MMTHRSSLSRPFVPCARRSGHTLPLEDHTRRWRPPLHEPDPKLSEFIPVLTYFEGKEENNLRQKKKNILHPAAVKCLVELKQNLAGYVSESKYFQEGKDG